MNEIVFEIISGILLIGIGLLLIEIIAVRYNPFRKRLQK